MIGDVRSFADGLPSEFDFGSQTGILFLLRAIRAAAVDPAEKNKLKDLVFMYSTGGKDDGVKRKLESTLESLGVTPASVLLEVPKVASVVPESVITAGASGFPVGRRVPVFSTPDSSVLAAKVSAPVVAVTPQQSMPVTIETQPVKNDVVEVVPVVPVQKITPVTPVPPVRPIVPVPTPSSSNEPSAQPVVANNIEITKKETTVPIIEQTPAVTATRMERIRIIKSDVNARVGNPVNLVDVDNTIGREYMSSLLEAMKLLSSASEQESQSAMNRLETAYAQVLMLLETKLKESAVEAPVTPVVSPVVVPIPQPAESVPAPVSSIDLVQPVAEVSIADFSLRSKVTDRSEVTTAANTSDWEVADQTAVAQAPVAFEENISVVSEVVPAVISAVTPVYTPEITQSVSSVTPLRAITELPTADEVSAIESEGNNPLYTKDIDAGLDQLLSEWSLFKKSGLFGAGPKGREHPLYVKISPLQVPLILSGRFEGSTQEIKQSITDYMNGWRYEQGIIYEANETLDQYLRRVIRHIIDLQKAKRRS